MSEVLVAPAAVVEDFDELADGRSQRVAGGPVMSIEELGLEGREKLSATALSAGVPERPMLPTTPEARR